MLAPTYIFTKLNLLTRAKVDYIAHFYTSQSKNPIPFSMVMFSNSN